MKIEDISKRLQEMGGCALDFRENMDGIEEALIDLAQMLSVVDKEDATDFVPAQGRALKNLAPAWCNFIRGEVQRNEEQGPAFTIVGLTRAAALLIALSCMPAVKSKAHLKGLVGHLAHLFRDDLESFAPGYQDVETKH